MSLYEYKYRKYKAKFMELKHNILKSGGSYNNSMPEPDSEQNTNKSLFNLNEWLELFKKDETNSNTIDDQHFEITPIIANNESTLIDTI